MPGNSAAVPAGVSRSYGAPAASIRRATRSSGPPSPAASQTSPVGTISPPPDSASSARHSSMPRAAERM